MLELNKTQDVYLLQDFSEPWRWHEGLCLSKQETKHAKFPRLSSLGYFNCSSLLSILTDKHSVKQIWGSMKTKIGQLDGKQNPCFMHCHTLHFWLKCITLGAIMPHLYERQKVVLYLNPLGRDLLCIYLLCYLRKSNDVFLSQSSLHYSQIKVNHIPWFFSFLYLCAGSLDVKFLKSVSRRKLYPYETASRPLYLEIVIWVKWPTKC